MNGLVLARAAMLVGLLPAAALCRGQRTADIGQGANAMKNGSNASAEMKVVSVSPGRPPLVRLAVDLVLRNETSEPHWFLVPKEVPRAPGPGGVDAVEVFVSNGIGRAVVGRFLGTGGFQAFLLPPASQVIYRKLPLSLWSEDPTDSVSLDVLFVRDLQVGGRPAQEWFPEDPTCDRNAEVSSEHEKMLSSRRSPDGREQPVSYVIEERLPLRVSLPR